MWWLFPGGELNLKVREKSCLQHTSKLLHPVKSWLLLKISVLRATPVRRFRNDLEQTRNCTFNLFAEDTETKNL